MATTVCEIAGVEYRLDYNKTSSKEGLHYWGHLYTQPVLDFSFTILSDSSIIFSPLKTYEHKRNAIIKSIFKHEDMSTDGGFVP